VLLPCSCSSCRVLSLALLEDLVVGGGIESLGLPVEVFALLGLMCCDDACAVLLVALKVGGR
jgi:hypothetical protein